MPHLLAFLSIILTLNTVGQVVDLGTTATTEFSSEVKQQLKQQFKDTRIIVLGEQTHGIGTEYKSFAQLVKFLHEEMGFNLIVQEYCFFSSHLVNQQFQKTASAQEFRNTMYWPQGKAKEYNVLFDYLDVQKAKGMKINVEGFDSRIANGTAVKEWIGAVILDNPSYYSDTKKPAKLLSIVERVIDLEYRDTISSKTDQKEVLNYLDHLTDYRAFVNDNPRDVQQLRSLKAFCNNAWNTNDYSDNDIRRYHFREQQMAENLIWLIDSVYPTEKVIVHMHNGHAAKSINLFQSYPQDSAAEYNITVGGILNDKYGHDCKIIGTTAYSGTHCKWDFKPTGIPIPHPKSLETELHQKGIQYGFVNLSDRTVEPFYMFFNDFNNWVSPPEIKAQYGQLFDGIIFFDSVKAPIAIPANSTKK